MKKLLALFVVGFCTLFASTSFALEDWEIERNRAATEFCIAWGLRYEVYENYFIECDWRSNFNAWWSWNQWTYSFQTQTDVNGKLTSATSKLISAQQALVNADNDMEDGYDYWVQGTNETNLILKEGYFTSAYFSFAFARTWYQEAEVQRILASNYLEQADNLVSGAGPNKPGSTLSYPSNQDVPEDLADFLGEGT